ncbi:hypothetical protein UPYG_G00130850 [Umbra pygmaea]|uniref:DISC1 scaffold protein n=1 Tax=Umbra pygmaea TaxID=75934 RepID=A0ABD0WT26_UMBPY
MFAGMMRRQCRGSCNDTDRDCCAKELRGCPGGTEGGSAGSSYYTTLHQHQRPGYLRTDLPRRQSTQETDSPRRQSTQETDSPRRQSTQETDSPRRQSTKETDSPRRQSTQAGVECGAESYTSSIPLNQSDRGKEVLSSWLWQDWNWKRVGLGAESTVTSELAEAEPECDSSSVSVGEDSDAASASSLTSGSLDQLVKKYEEILQGCLRNNRAHTKIESMMFQVQRLQQQAILQDDYDSAERFDQQLEDLRRERGSLRLGLPSKQPSLALFLHRLREAVHSALNRREDHSPQNVTSGAVPGSDTHQDPWQNRDYLLQEKHQVEMEMTELQQRLEELQARRRSLELQIQQKEEEQDVEEVQGLALRSCSHAQLRDMGRALDDVVTSQNRTKICVSPPAAWLRLQEQEKTLSLAIKDATAKVVMSQRLGGSLQRKVSETETQLLMLYEAKLAAISGNDFISARELKAEMAAMYGERDRLELLVKRLHSLSSRNSLDLAHMKAQQKHLRHELATRQAQHEQSLKENTAKYIELLEDKIHSSGCPLERIWEADLEACHLLLRGIQVRTPSCSGLDPEDPPTPTAPLVEPNAKPSTKPELDLQECAMLTALGGRWCPEANLQNSEFTKPGLSS